MKRKLYRCELHYDLELHFHEKGREPAMIRTGDLVCVAAEHDAASCTMVKVDTLQMFKADRRNILMSFYEIET